MQENEIARRVVNLCFQIHQTMGPGLFESVYEEILCYELHKTGLVFDRQRDIPVYWDDQKMEKGFRADLVVENKVLIELKSVAELENVHYKQVLTYLKLSRLKLGLLVNFNEALIKDGIHRVVNGL
ncbi:MAG: GxxExxY protein [Saprospiraceae bacterium]|nr:GxxExxY protein [Saprospiraceae bacterium]